MFEEILSEWEKDYKIDLSNLEESFKKIQESSGKYFNLLYKINKQLNITKTKLEELKRAKYLYYNGNGTKEEYSKNPLNIKILKADIPMFIKSDNEVLNLEAECNELEELKSIIKEMINLIKNSNFMFKSIVELRKLET